MLHLKARATAGAGAFARVAGVYVTEASVAAPLVALVRVCPTTALLLGGILGAPARNGAIAGAHTQRPRLGVILLEKEEKTEI